MLRSEDSVGRYLGLKISKNVTVDDAHLTKKISKSEIKSCTVLLLGGTYARTHNTGR